MLQWQQMRLHKLHPPVGSSVFSDAHNTPLAHTLLRTRCSSLQRQNRAQLSWECAEEVFRQQLEADDDIRLNIRLFQKCLGDKKRFCADVQPGHAAARDCLVASRDMQGFTAPCRCGRLTCQTRVARGCHPSAVPAAAAATPADVVMPRYCRQGGAGDDD
jgi:Cysteine rich repeat